MASLDEIVAFMHQHLIQRRKNVLVHCGAGISRSGAAVVAWLMARHGVGRDEALAKVQLARKWVRPNDNFIHLHIGITRLHHGFRGCEDYGIA